MNIFFTSDLHFGHANIIKYCNRPFKDVDHMNETLVQYWNETVAPGDAVYCLGDFSMNVPNMEKFTPRLNGRKCLVPGNHDKCWKPSEQCIERYTNAGWLVLSKQEKFFLDHGGYVLLSHLPYASGAPDTRKFSYPVDDGYTWLLHGHTHNPTKINGRQVHIGVDAWDYKPVHLDRIKEIIDEVYDSADI